MHVDDVVVAVEVVTPDLGEQLLAGEGAPWRRREQVQQIELDLGELEDRPGLRHLPYLQVDAQLAVLADGFAADAGAGARAAPHRLDARRELTRRERLGDVVVGAHGEPDHLVQLVGASGDHDDVGVGELPDLPAHLDAVDVGQAQIEDRHVRALLLGAFHGLLTVTGGDDLEALLLQQVAADHHELGGVLDDERAWFGHEISQGGG